MTKYTDEQPDEEKHRVTSWRVLSTEVFISMEVKYITLPVWMCSPTWKLPEMSTIKSSLWRMGRRGRGAENPKLQWLGVSGDQPPSRSHPGAHSEWLHYNKKCSYYSYHLGSCKGFRNSVPRTVGRDQSIYRFSLISQNLPEFTGFWLPENGKAGENSWLAAVYDLALWSLSFLCIFQTF